MGEGGAGGSPARGAAQASEGEEEGGESEGRGQKEKDDEEGRQEGVQEEYIISRRPGPVSVANAEPGPITTGARNLRKVSNSLLEREAAAYGSLRHVRNCALGRDDK